MTAAEDMQERALRFDQAVEQFLRKQNLSWSDEKAWNRETISQFLSTSIIGAYLTRPAKDLAFDEKGEPSYFSQYEKRIYALLKVPYRRDAAFYYSTGTPHDVLPLQDIMIAKNIQAASFPPDIHCEMIINHRDVPQFGAMLHRIHNPQVNDCANQMATLQNPHFELAEEGISFLVFPALEQGLTSGHGIGFAAVIDNKTHKVRALLMVNSWQKEEYLDWMEERINYKTNHPEYKEAGAERIPIIDCSLDVQKAEDDKGCGLYRLRFAQALVAMAEKHPELIRDLVKNPPLSETQIKEDKQWAKDEAEKKALILREKMTGVLRGISDKEIAEILDKTHWAGIVQSNEEQLLKHTPHLEIARERIAPALKEALREEMPEFFTAQGERRADDEVRTAQCRLRWETGNADLRQQMELGRKTEAHEPEAKPSATFAAKLLARFDCVRP